jgi:hypothetical protein
MPLVSVPVGSLTIAALALAALVTWLVRDRRHPGPRLVGREPRIDRGTLDAAEREVRTHGRGYDSKRSRSGRTSATDAQPDSPTVRSKSARKLSSTSRTPASPPTASPQA